MGAAPPPADREASAVLRATYEIRIAGPLPPQLLAGLGDAHVSFAPPETVLHRTAVDQDALADVLDELHGLGLTVTELHRLPVGSSSPVVP